MIIAVCLYPEEYAGVTEIQCIEYLHSLNNESQFNKTIKYWNFFQFDKNTGYRVMYYSFVNKTKNCTETEFTQAGLTSTNNLS